MKKVKGKKLIFLGMIDPKGNSIADVSKKDLSCWNDDFFALNRLSLTFDTYIASGMYSYVVKLKQ